MARRTEPNALLGETGNSWAEATGSGGAHGRSRDDGLQGLSYTARETTGAARRHSFAETLAWCVLRPSAEEARRTILPSRPVRDGSSRRVAVKMSASSVIAYFLTST